MKYLLVLVAVGALGWFGFTRYLAHLTAETEKMAAAAAVTSVKPTPAPAATTPAPAPTASAPPPSAVLMPAVMTIAREANPESLVGVTVSQRAGADSNAGRGEPLQEVAPAHAASGSDRGHRPLC
jgi:hypothetical protein